MGAAHRGKIAERLMAGGLPPETPVAAVQWGTVPGQVTRRTTLGELGTAPLAPPVTMVIGEVAGLNLSWFEDRPLFGSTVVVTRAVHQASSLSRRLRDLGAQVMEIPVIGLGPPSDGGAALRASIPRVTGGNYSWVVFTSANAVRRFFELVPDTRSLGPSKVATVGPSTAKALRDYRVVADLVPDDYRAEGLLESFPPPAPPPGPASVITPSGRRCPARAARRAGGERLASRRRGGLPDCAAGGAPGVAGGGSTGRRHLFCLFVGRRQLPRPGRRGRRWHPAHRGLYWPGHGGHRPLPRAGGKRRGL